VSLAHYPGGLSALANAGSPPWWANVLGLLGLWTGFAGAIYYAYAYGNLRSLPHQWQVTPSDLIYMAVGVACQFIVDAAYIPFHVHHLNRPVNHLFGSVVGASFVLLIIMTTFLAPIMEEWLFRGVLFRALSEGGRRGGSRASVVLVSYSARSSSPSPTVSRCSSRACSSWVSCWRRSCGERGVWCRAS